MSKKDVSDMMWGRCTAGRVLRAARSVTRLYDEALKPAGLTITQYGLMKAIAGIKPSSISYLAEILDIERSALSRNLKPLEAAGWVFRGNEGTSRRRRLLLTTLGQEKLESAHPLWLSVQERVDEAFGKAGLEDLYSGLRLLSTNKLTAD